MFAETRKAWVAGLCLVVMAALDAALVELPLPGTAQGWIKVIAVGVGAFLTYLVPNAKAAPGPAERQGLQ
jgi:hypothetical protein